VSDSIWMTLSAGISGALIGAAATITAALITRQPTLTDVIDGRIKVLLETYERTIRDLRAEVGLLEDKVDYLSTELKKVRPDPIPT
jgi:hypothetical protein